MYLVYDITKRSSFLSLQKWIEEIRRFTATNISWILIGIFTFQLTFGYYHDFSINSNNDLRILLDLMKH